jgi:hypothetical protein
LGKKSLDERDFPLFTRRRNPVGEGRSNLALCFGWPEVPPNFCFGPK